MTGKLTEEVQAIQDNMERIFDKLSEIIKKLEDLERRIQEQSLTKESYNEWLITPPRKLFQ